MAFNLDIKGADQKPTAPVMKTESLAQETLPFVKEENKDVVKAEERKDVIKADSEKNKLNVEKSDEVPKVKKREDSLKVEEGKESTLKIEENRVSLRDPLQCVKSENTRDRILMVQTSTEGTSNYRRLPRLKR
ncbi:hypothetical protein B0H12DRAFT_1157407 [Mycena haematopus]|nr:hypothetical protein B0H12DRAFT_1157407 [Mycena haematopus]